MGFDEYVPTEKLHERHFGHRPENCTNSHQTDLHGKKEALEDGINQVLLDITCE